MVDTNVPPSRQRMDEGQLKSILGQKITGSLGFLGGQLSKERLTAEQYYKGEPFGDEMVGRSQVVSRDVAESVDGMLPPLLKVFCSGDEIVRFEPRRPEHEQMADQATELVNWKWFVKNPGFSILHDWFKDALLKKLGVIKIYWEEGFTNEKETYHNLTEAEYQIIKEDDEVEVIEVNERQSLYGAPHLGVTPGPQTAGIPTQPVYDIICRRSKKYGCAKIINVPPDEFLIDHRAVALEEAGFLCHRAKKTITELKEMGFDADIVDTLGPDGANDFNMERIERFKDEDAYPYRDDNFVDPSMREVWINECYVKIDYDGDGIAELRQVFLAGESTYTLLRRNGEPANIEIDDHPFATLTPIPMPHKVFGMSMADMTLDLQRIKSALVRGSLDSIYFNIAPMVGLVEGQVNLDDLLNRRPGGVVRMKNKDAIVPMQAEPLVQDAWQMIEYMDGVRESRTGVKRFNSSLDPDQVNPLAKTATAAMLADNAADDRLQLIARIFAETGIKRASLRILELICKHQDQKQAIRLNGQFVEIDPREWTTEMDVTVSVGLGTGNKDRINQALMGIAPLYAQMIAAQQGISGPIVTGENLYNFLDQVVRSSPIGKGTERYFTDPSKNPQPPQPPKPDPHMVKAQGELAIQQAKTQADLQAQKARLEADTQLASVKAGHEMELDKQKAGLQAQLEQQKAQHQMDLERMKLGHQMEIDKQKLQHEAAMSAQTLQGEMGLQSAKSQHDASLAEKEMSLKEQAQQHEIGLKQQTVQHDMGLKAKSAEHDQRLNEQKVKAKESKEKPRGKRKITIERDKDGKIIGAVSDDGGRMKIKRDSHGKATGAEEE